MDVVTVSVGVGAMFDNSPLVARAVGEVVGGGFGVPEELAEFEGEFLVVGIFGTPAKCKRRVESFLKFFGGI